MARDGGARQVKMTLWTHTLAGQYLEVKQTCDFGSFSFRERLEMIFADLYMIYRNMYVMICSFNPKCNLLLIQIVAIALIWPVCSSTRIYSAPE
jgi:hypothetical protein